jgi:hypothetical protein
MSDNVEIRDYFLRCVDRWLQARKTFRGHPLECHAQRELAQAAVAFADRVRIRPKEDNTP